MNITIISNLYTPNLIGGAERMVQILAEGLVQLDHKVSVITLNPLKENIFEEINGVKVFYVSYKNIYMPYFTKDVPIYYKTLWHIIDTYNPMAISQLKKKFLELKSEIVHSHNLAGFSTSVWDAARSLRIPVIHTLHDYYLMCYRSTMYKNSHNCVTQCFSCRLLSTFKRYTSNKVDSVIGVSDFIIKSHINSKFFEQTVLREVIPNGKDLFILENENRNLLNTMTLKLGYLGRITLEKGVENLLQQFSRSANDHILYIAGEGKEDYTQYLKNIYESNRIVFLGLVEAKEFLSSVNYLIVPSLWNDPFPSVVFESYSLGVPVIAHAVGGLKRMIKHGDTGYLYESDDELVNILESEKLSEYLSHMSKNALYESTKYRKEQYIENYIRVYLKTVKKRGVQ